jgi:hypothetical protein
MTVHTIASGYKGAAQAAQLIQDGEPFNNAGKSFTGVTRHYYGPGRMCAESAELFNSHLRNRQVDYVMRSYATPVAYHLTTGAWIVPTDTYSVTTAKHMSRVWAILRELGVDTRFEWVPDVSPVTGKPLKSKSHREQVVFLPFPKL